MGNRTIKAPGVEIIEHDLSGYTTTNLGTGCLIAGFAQKGEDLEPIKITNRSAWLLNFGTPTNEAEEYFYNAGMEVLNQGGFLHAAKIPYSNDIAGIYCAAKYKISDNSKLYRMDDEQGQFYKDELTEDGDRDYLVGEEEQPNSPMGRFWKNYASLKDLGLNSLQLIAPAGQDFLSKDLVEEYETGESEPASNTIYLVDKTRAIYSRAPEIADKQDNRDSRACIGIVPVITTMCNTAWFQKESTGVESYVNELYQPIRSLKTITFPAGAASAAEYQPTKFVESDLHTQLMKDGTYFGSSLSQRAATIAQSCLVNGNLVDGKFKPFICNDVCVVVFKAFVSTEDGKIDFDVVETWVGSLDPLGRDEKGRTTFIDTIINNNSEYIYCFSNLENPQKVLNPDHGFVAGSDSEYHIVEEDVKSNKEYIASSLFSAYASRMLGFGENRNPDDTTGLEAPEWVRDFTYETIEPPYDNPGGDEMSEIAVTTMGSLRAFYNSDARKRICTLDTLTMGKKYSSVRDIVPYTEGVNDDIDKAINEFILEKEDKFNGGHFSVSDKYIAETPKITYTIQREAKDVVVPGESTPQNFERIDGAIAVNLTLRDATSDDPITYTYDDYIDEIRLGATKNGEFVEEDNSNFRGSFYNPQWATEKIMQLSILNSSDYLRAIYDFETLINPDNVGLDVTPDDEDYEVRIAKVRQAVIQSLIIDSIMRSGRYKAHLRYFKKARINLDKLNNAFNDYIAPIDSTKTTESMQKKNLGKKYIEDLYKSFKDTGLLSGIAFVEDKDNKPKKDSTLEKKDALEAKLDAIINVDTTKKEKMSPRMSYTSEDDPETELVKKYLLCRLYLNSQYNAKLATLLTTIAKIMEDCCYAQQRYVESQRNIDDSNIMLGFYPEMAEPIITYSTIAQSLNKIFDTMSDIHTSEIDVVCDAGISNIAQFVKQVYDPSADDGEDVGGLYQPVKYSAYFKFNKNTDLAYWKTIVYKFDTFCKFRGDCMFCTEGPRGMVLIGNKQVVRKTKKDTNVDINILPYLSKIAGFNTSYGAGYLNWYRTISDYTGDTLWIPPSIKAMGTYILTDKQYNWWDAPAGMRRGVINMVETSFNPNRIQAGEIYDTNWNYAIHYLNDGIIQEGQKTFQTRQSALDRVNVRRLLGRIKRYVYFASRQFLYEPHTQAIREKYVKTIKPFFEDLVNRGGLYDFKIICDSSNNTPEVIDRNELRVKIGIKPVKTIEFIIVDLCVLNTGASWTEMDSV